MSIHAIAPDDVVRTHQDARRNDREPLLVLEPLTAFLDAHGLGEGAPVAAPLGDGHSNVTYVIAREGLEVVVRRPPRGPLPPSAHDVLREARVLRALQGRVRVPPVLAVCDDPAVIGAPFYVMERVDGHVVTDRVPEALDEPAQRRRIGEELVDALVEIHAVDIQAAGLETLGRPSGYLERQLKRFAQLWEVNRTRDVPAVETVGRWLEDHRPGEVPPTIVHGDFRLGNTIFAPHAPARLAAVIDWEMATIGDPLADLGYLTAVYTDREDPPVGMFDLASVTREPGFPRRDELIARYEARSGRTAAGIRWYQTLALWKSVVFMEGNYRRAISGASDDPFNLRFREGVVELAERALRLTRARSSDEP